MAIYPVAPKQEVYDLINEANPGLTKPVTPTNCALGAPAVIANAVHPAPNTTILVSPAPGNNDYIGKQTLRYKRRDLSKLFRGITVQVTKFASRNPATATALAFTIYELLPDINKLYGLNLTEDDVNNANIIRGNTLENGQYTTTVTVTTRATSLGYVGSFGLKWLNTLQSLADMITNADLDGRLFPGGNLFDETHKEVIDSQSFGLDATIPMANSAPSNSPFGKQVINWNSWSQWYRNIMLPWLNQQLAGNGTTINWNYDVSQTYLQLKGSIANMSHAIYALPSTAFPAGNGKSYGFVLVIFIPDDCPWAAGNLYFHFNK
jgi:hypothetical protein